MFWFSISFCHQNVFTVWLKNNFFQYILSSWKTRHILLLVFFFKTLLIFFFSIRKNAITIKLKHFWKIILSSFKTGKILFILFCKNNLQFFAFFPLLQKQNSSFFSDVQKLITEMCFNFNGKGDFFIWCRKLLKIINFYISWCIFYFWNSCL